MEHNWYILYNGSQVGPMDKSQLLHYQLNPNSQVWHEGMNGWAPAYTIPELMSMLPVNSSATPGYNSYGTGTLSGKSNVAAGILAIFLGYLGVQYFYCGKVAGGFICILLTILTCGIWDIVSLIQGIIMLTMTPEKFDATYVNTDKAFPLF